MRPHLGSRRSQIAAGVLIVGLAAGGAVAASAQDGSHAGGSEPAPTSQELTAVQVSVLEAMENDSPIPVQDPSGKVRGFVRDSVLTARDQRVTDQVMKGFRERKNGVDEEYDALFEALRILDPVPVLDEQGQTVGYWTHNFKEPSELEALAPGARATVARLLPDGTGD